MGIKMAENRQNRINFTKISLAKLPIPATGRNYVYDTQVTGLGVMIFPSGTKTFFLYKRIGQRVEKIKLGRYPDLSIENARSKAHEQLALIAGGKNPAIERKKIRSELTLGELFDLFVERHAKPHKKPSSLKADKDNFERYFGQWKNRQLSSLSHNDVMALHSKVGKTRGIYIANKILALLSAMFNKAKNWGWEGGNPATGIRKFKEKSRDRFLQPHEMPFFFEALDNEPNTTARDYILLSLLTGARKANVMAMRWDQIDFDRTQWRIPETKNGEPLIVPLSQQAVGVLKARRKEIKGAWVFPSETSVKGHLQEPKKAWRRILRRAELYQLIELLAKTDKWSSKRITNAKQEAESDTETYLEAYYKTARTYKLDTSNIGLPDIRIHDLRRSLGSWQAVTGASGFIIGKSLGHKTQQATAIYARLNLDPVRDSVERATEAMMLAARRKP